MSPIYILSVGWYNFAMFRRSFFGIIATPLLRKFTPPEPAAQAFPPLSRFGFEQTINDDHGVFSNLNPQPLSVENLKAALEELARMKDESGVPVLLDGPVYLHIPEEFD